MPRHGLLLSAVGVAFGAVCSAAIADPGDSIDFVTIGAPGNPGQVTANPNELANGRGGVAYEYRIGRMEVTTAQWVEFFNAAFARPQSEWIPFVPNGGIFWGATPTTPTVPGGLRWTVTPSNANRPVGDITWRTAAIYCNWLHNGGGTDRSAFLTGAYDISTFGYTGTIGNIFTDQTTHSPEARYWIPTWDEWIKAAHYDPNKNGPGQGGYWEFPNASDVPLIYGPPGVGQANSGYNNPSPFGIPLGSYPGEQSPWGLLDVAGETAEWTEEVRTLLDGARYRIYEGSSWGQSAVGARNDDRAGERAGDQFPSAFGIDYGFRVASSIPSPGTYALGVGALTIFSMRKRRGCVSPTCSFCFVPPQH